LINFNNATLLRPIGTSFMVQYSIPVQAYAVLFGDLGEFEQFVLGTPFGAFGALLIKLAEVV
jgi:hypothetical protein